MDAKVSYDEIADMLFVRFNDKGGYVHYHNEHFATVHDEDTDEVVGLHIEGWSFLKAESVKDAKERRAYIPSPQPEVITKRVIIGETIVRPPLVIGLDDDDWR